MPRKTANILIIAFLIFGIVLGFILAIWFRPTKSSVLTELFSYPDGSICQQPCILGIQPFESTPGQAIAMLKSHPLTKGNVIQQSHLNGKDYLTTNLEENSLQVKVDYGTNQVLEVTLTGEGVNELGFTGIDINGMVLNWNGVRKYLGEPRMVTAAAGDGGIITFAAGLYDAGWCIEAGTDDSYPLTIPLDSKIIRIEINCPDLKYLDMLNP